MYVCTMHIVRIEQDGGSTVYYIIAVSGYLCDHIVVTLSHAV